MRAVSAGANCTGVWARSSHNTVLDWSRLGQTRNCRITFKDIEDNGATGDTETLTGPAYLTNLELGGVKGQKWSSSFELIFDGLPDRANKA